MSYLKYTMSQSSEVSKKAADDIEAYLKSLSETVGVENVEDDTNYRTKDIDLIWKKNVNGSTFQEYIEIKGDRWYKTGNYFFETVSNEGKQTPGCFMYTEADFIYYYFVNEKELHILPMPATRDWFCPQIDNFKEKKTSTPVGGSSYVTVGRLVPRDMVLKEVPGVKIIKI